MSRRCCFVAVLPNAWFLWFHCPLFCICPWALGGSGIRTVPFVAVLLGHLFSLNFDLWPSTLTASHFSKKKSDVSAIYTNLWIEKYQCRWQFDSMIIQQNNSNRSIQGIWAICWICRTRNAFPLIEQTLNPIRKHLISLRTSEPLLHPRDLSCQACPYVAHSIHSFARLFSPRSLNGIFWYYEN